MEIYINKIHYPINNLGAGTRLGIWFQGCPIRCPGCVNRDTWEAGEEYRLDYEEFIRALLSFENLDSADGVTITGGEPFAQPRALLELAGFLRKRIKGDILVYSGYAYDELKKKYPDILKSIDVLISEPFIESAGDRLLWRGSDNQKIWLLSKKASAVYGRGIDRAEWKGRRMQFSIVGDSLYMIGIPGRGDMEKLYEVMKKRGIDFEHA